MANLERAAAAALPPPPPPNGESTAHVDAVMGQEGVGSIGRSFLQVVLLPLFLPCRVGTEDTWRNAISHLLVCFLTLIGIPLRLLGNALQWFLNFHTINGGSFLRILFAFLLEWRLQLPDCTSPEYYSVIAFLDPRFELTDVRSDRIHKLNSKECAELCVMSAKLAYETEIVQRRVVNEKWNMSFHKFYSCHNARTSQATTEAFIFKDRSEDAKLIVLAFRGTEPFDAQDWATDLDFGWYELTEGAGAVHVGFLEALGIQSRTNKKPLRVRAQSNVNFAYSVISRDLRSLMLDNPEAQLIFTGHSLGGALAVLLAGLMIYLQYGTEDKGAQKVLQSLKAIYTFGQPRVGNQTFADYLTRSLEQYEIEYHRVVYNYDLVSRIPFDDTLFRFKHAGRMCNFYNAFYTEKGLREEPDANLFDIMFFITARITAVVELCNGLFFNRWSEGDWYRETNLMLIARIVGLFLPGLTGHAPTNYVNAICMGPENLSTAIKH